MSWPKPSTLLLALVGGFAAGCGDGRGAVPLSGTVLLDGRPLARATVAFVPEEDGRRPAAGVSDENGRFELTTFTEGDGALPGGYRVIVTKVEPVPALAPASSTGVLDKEEQMEARFETTQQHRRQVRPQLPLRYGRIDATPFSCTVPADEPIVLELSSQAK
jgi:hypothetical protein